MITLLDNTKSLTVLVNDNTNGLGQLTTTDAFKDEELNGINEIEFNFLQSDKHFKDLSIGGLVKATVDEAQDEQIYRIYYISKPMNEVVNVKAQHISYDLGKVPVRPFTATGAVNAKNGMLNNMIGTYPFTMSTDINNNASVFTLDIPRSFRECLGGYEGSLLDTFQCEYEWDNLEVKMLAHRGSDEGVRISYGKNLTDFKQEENIENVYTAVLGYAVVDDVTYIGDVYNKIVTTYPKVMIVDFSNDYESGDVPTTTELTTKAQDYATRNSIEVPQVNLTISFVPLYQTEEYKNIAPLERVSLGDTVHVYFEKLGVEATARVIKTRWNINLNRYDSIELGSVKANLTTVINNAVESAAKEIVSNIDVDTGFIENQLNEMGSLIINGLGLFKTTVELAGGGYRIYLHNKPNLADSDTQYYISANGLVVSTDYGQTWNAGFDPQGNAVVNSLSTITLKALEIYGSYLCFGDYPNGKYIEASTYSDSSDVQQGVSFDGTGTIRMRPQEQFIVDNQAADGSANYNILSLTKTTTNNVIKLENYKFSTPTQYANRIEMSATATLDSMNLYNYSTNSNTIANSMWFTASNSLKRIYIYNYDANASTKANEICLTAQPKSNFTYIYNYEIGTANTVNTIILYRDEITQNAFINRIDIINKNTNDRREANAIGMTSSQEYERNSFYIHNYKYNIRGYGNVINMQSKETESSFELRNQLYSDSGGKYANFINMVTNASGNTIRIQNNDTSDSQVNYIDMNSTNAIMTLYSNSDIRINSNGAVRLTSGSSQDITLTASDDIYMVWNGKLRMNGKNVYLASNGYVMWDNQ